MLSFSVQFAVQTTDRAARWCQVLAWIFLGVTGMLALRDAGGFVAKYTQDVSEGLSPTIRRFMWVCFFLGVVLLAARLISVAHLTGWTNTLTRAAHPRRLAITKDMSSIRAAVQSFYADIWNQHDRSKIPVMLHADFTFRGSLGQTLTVILAHPSNSHPHFRCRPSVF
jgi:hypothetical protein